MTTFTPATEEAFTPEKVNAWVVPDPVGSVAVCSPRELLLPSDKVTLAVAPPQLPAVSLRLLKVTVVTWYPGTAEL